MAIPRKGRRSITVDGIEYHYKIAFERSERAVIQRADSSGASLFVFPFTIMKPSQVADAIQFGVASGWAPNQKGLDCWLTFDVDAVGRSCFEHLPNDDFRAVTYSSRGGPSDHLDLSQFQDTRPWYDRPSPASVPK